MFFENTIQYNRYLLSGCGPSRPQTLHFKLSASRLVNSRPTVEERSTKLQLQTES